MDESAPSQTLTTAADILPPHPRSPAAAAAALALTPAGQAALAAAQVLAKKATAAATLRAYKADWTHFSQWCEAHGFIPVPAAPDTVGAGHRRRLSRQPGRNPCADDHPKAVVGTGEDASVQ